LPAQTLGRGVRYAPLRGRTCSREHARPPPAARFCWDRADAAADGPFPPKRLFHVDSNVWGPFFKRRKDSGTARTDVPKGVQGSAGRSEHRSEILGSQPASAPPPFFFPALWLPAASYGVTRTRISIS